MELTKDLRRLTSFTTTDMEEPVNSLISLGIALVMFPEPFMVSDVIGGGIIAAGFLYNRAVPPPMYVDDIFKTIEEQVKTIHQGGEGLSREFTIPLDFSAMHFNF